MKDVHFPDAWPFDFGTYIRKVRESRGLGLADVAIRSQGKLGASTVSVIERGRVQGGPSLRQLEGFSHAFELPTIYLFALAYSAANDLDPAVVDRVWQEFVLEKPDTQDEGLAAVAVPRQHLELLGVSPGELRFFSLRKDGLLSAEAVRQGYVAECDIVAVDSRPNAPAGSCVVGWWSERKKLVVYRQGLDVENVVIPAQVEGEPYLVLREVAKLKRLGLIVWRSGPLPDA